MNKVKAFDTHANLPPENYWEKAAGVGLAIIIGLALALMLAHWAAS